MNSHKDIGSICRIKVNTMLSSLNSNKNIFIPKYTITSRREEKYSYLNKSKGKSIRSNHKISNNNTNQKPKLNQTNILTTEDNYTLQPIDFIINHGVLVYQRNFKGEEVLNLGINNEYLRKNKFNMVKNHNSIYQTESCFTHNNNKSIYNTNNKQSYSIKKRLKKNYSRKTLSSISDIPFNNKNTSNSRQKKIINTNLNTTQNSISSLNSISVKNVLISSKNKIINNKNQTNVKEIVKNPKKVINFMRKKQKSNTEQNKFLIFRKKKNYSTFSGNNVKINNKSAIKDDNKSILQNNINNNYNTTGNNNNINCKEDNNNMELDDIINQPISKDINSERNDKIIQFIKSFKILLKYYLNKYFIILKDNPLENNNIKDKCNEKTDIDQKSDNENKIVKININKKIIDRCKHRRIIENSPLYQNDQKHLKANSILVNKKKVSSNSTTHKDITKNTSNHNLSLLITKNLRFFSNDNKHANTNNNEERKSELYRDSKSLQKKYEQICRRKRKNLTRTYTNRFKNNNYGVEKFNLSDTNKTNSFSNLNDNNSVNSLQTKSNKIFNQIFYKDNSMNNNTNYDIMKYKLKNLTENKKDKNIYKIKLIKNNHKMISYRIEKKNPKNILINNENLKANNNSHNYFETKDNNNNLYNNLINNNNNDSSIPKKYCININNKNKTENNYIGETNNILPKKIFIHKKKHFLLEDKDYIKKEINAKKGKIVLNSHIIKNKNISLLIKNICTKDKRITIHISYRQYNPNKKINNNNQYNNLLLKKENITNYNYIPTTPIKYKNPIKGKIELVKKLSLIKEEDEKSKCLNSTKSSRNLEEELKSDKIINKKNKIIKNIKNIKDYNPKIKILIKLLDKSFYNYYYICKKDFIFKLKVVLLVSYMKNIIYKKIKDSHIIKYIKKIRKDKIGIVYCPKLKKQKLKNNIQKISNIYIKDKIYLNNIIINENILNSNSFDYDKNYKNIETSGIKQKNKHKDNIDNYEKSSLDSKKENVRYNIND